MLKDTQKIFPTREINAGFLVMKKRPLSLTQKLKKYVNIITKELLHKPPIKQGHLNFFEVLVTHTGMK